MKTMDNLIIGSKMVIWGTFCALFTTTYLVTTAAWFVCGLAFGDENDDRG